METYGKILLIAMPIFLLLVMLEKMYGWLAKGHPFKNMDMISSMSSGYTNIIKDVLKISVALLGYDVLVRHVAVVQIQATWLTYLVAFVALDFSGYWVHRLSHQINFFWNKHAIHHSSEEFNLACALRQSISSFVSLFTIFLLPAALLGVPEQVINVVAPLHLFAQFWYHTTYIGRMGFLEKIIVTPSHHRVHHAINPEYLDKNHSQIFIVWDKLFGTFQAELPHVAPVYGITRPAQTWNPIKINFQHLWLLMKDFWHTANWRDKARVWWMPTGWRPDDVQKSHPVFKIDDPYHFEKYAPAASLGLIGWSWVQFFFTFWLICFFFLNIGKLDPAAIFLYGGFIYLSVFAYTELMDGNRWALLWEGGKNGIGLLLFIQTDWFGLEKTSLAGYYFTAAYFVLSNVVVGYFVWYESRRTPAVPSVEPAA
jgi:alkylglycerol monooxygenase